MAEDVTAARGAVFEIEDAVQGTWHDLTPYIERMEPDDSAGTQRKDAETWADGGFATSRVTGRGMSFKGKFRMKRETTSGEVAPALGRILELGRAQLSAAQGRLRWREHEDLTEWEIWGCNVDVKARGGGGAYDLAPIEAEITTSGSPSYAATP